MRVDQYALERVAGPVSRETLRDLETFSAQFLRWNQSINLVSSASLDDLWGRHIVDSAQVVRFARDAKCWVDMGSGGGFPAIIVALLRRDIDVHLIESNRKKAAFLQSAIGTFRLNARVHASRVQDCEITTPVDIVSARALAELDVLLEFSQAWLGNRARGLFLKGRGYATELKEIADGWSFDLIEHPSLTESQSVILEFSNVRRR